MKAATESTVAKKSDAEKKAEKENQRAELEALKLRSAVAAKAKKAEEAARQQTNKANIVAQYGQYDEVGDSESEGGQSAVEDWEIWGDPREVGAPLQLLLPRSRGCSMLPGMRFQDTRGNLLRCIVEARCVDQGGGRVPAIQHT